MNLIEKYIAYVRNVKRYSSRTVDIYTEILNSFYAFVLKQDEFSDRNIISSLNQSEIRQYIATNIKTSRFSSRTANLHLSVLSGFCRYLIKEGHIKGNPVRLVPRPKLENRLPAFYKNATPI